MPLSVVGEGHHHEECEEKQEIPEFYWDKPHFLERSKKFIPYIFNGQGSIPQGFNAVWIELNGRCTSDLNWSEKLAEAEQHVGKGLKLLWNLDLGLFKDLKHPLSHQTQFMTLGLALKHFQENVWKKFKNQTIGLCLYQGTLNLHEEIKEHQLENPHSLISEHFCQDVAMDFFDLLSANINDEIQPFILLDASQARSSLVARLLVHESISGFHLVLKNSIVMNQEMVWDGASYYGFIGAATPIPGKLEQVKTGLCLSSTKGWDQNKVEEFIQEMQLKNVSFRVISEDNLTMEWEGLDTLMVFPDQISVQGRRKLQGFVAAGGNIIEINELRK